MKTETRDEQIERLQGNLQELSYMDESDRQFLGEVGTKNLVFLNQRAGRWDSSQNSVCLPSNTYRVNRNYNPEPEQLTTPPGIKFWVGETSKKVMGLLFNKDEQRNYYKQCLMYCYSGEVFTVDSCYGFDPARIKECLPLVQCTYEDLQLGEFVLRKESKSIPSESYLANPANYDLILPENKLIYTFSSTVSALIEIPQNHNYYKVGK